MEHTLDFDSSGSYFVITATGDPDPAGFVRYLEDLINEPRWKLGTPFLVDLRNPNISLLNSQDVRDIGEAHVPYVCHIGESRIAGIVSIASHFGLVRMFQGVTNDMLRNLQVFYNMDEGKAWVESGYLEPE